MKTKGAMVLALSNEEKRAFALVGKVLKTMQEQGEQYRVMNLETGECVDFSELGRVRGIIGCFENGGEYEVTRVGKPSIYADATKWYPNPLANSDEELPLIGGDKAWTELMHMLGIC